MQYWTENLIAASLDGHLYSMEIGEFGRVRVIDLYQPEYAPPPKREIWTDEELQALYDLKRRCLPIEVISDQLQRPLANVVIQWGRRWHWRHRIDPRRRSAATLEEIARAVRDVYDVKKLEFQSARRAKRITEARQVFFWLARRFTAHSFPIIANYAGGKDHSTAIHGMKKIDQQMDRFRGPIDIILFDLGLDMESGRESDAA